MKEINKPDSSGDKKLEKRAQAISRYLQKISDPKSHPGVGREEEKEITEYYQELPLKERVNALYEKLMAYTIEKQFESTQKKESKKNKST